MIMYDYVRSLKFWDFCLVVSTKQVYNFNIKGEKTWRPRKKIVYSERKKKKK